MSNRDYFPTGSRVQYVGLDHTMQGLRGEVIMAPNWRNPDKAMIQWDGYGMNHWERLINLEAVIA